MLHFPNTIQINRARLVRQVWDKISVNYAANTINIPTYSHGFSKLSTSTKSDIASLIGKLPIDKKNLYDWIEVVHYRNTSK